MRPPLPQVFREIPLAHRALHDANDARPENSRAAVRAAVAAGYGIEIDLQLSSDGEAMVFHDYDLRRLTGRAGPIRGISAQDAGKLELIGGDGEGIPTLQDVLNIVDGSVPVLIELKDQDGGMGPNIGALEAATQRALADYDGPAAVMSFNPHSVAELHRLAPTVPRGLTTCSYDPTEWPLPTATCDRLRTIPDFESSGSAFISHNHKDLDRPRVHELHDAGVPVLCWTVRSPEEDAKARRVADNVTFEGYLPPVPG